VKIMKQPDLRSIVIRDFHVMREIELVYSPPLSARGGGHSTLDMFHSMWTRGATNPVLRPRGAMDPVVRPRGATDSVVRPRGATDPVVIGRGNHMGTSADGSRSHDVAVDISQFDKVSISRSLLFIITCLAFPLVLTTKF
jgi:hypothetical protein